MSATLFERLCRVGQLFYQDMYNIHIPLSERNQMFEENGSFDTPEEQQYKDHIQKCPVCKQAVS